MVMRIPSFFSLSSSRSAFTFYIQQPDPNKGFFHPSKIVNLIKDPAFMSIQYAPDECRPQRMTRCKNHSGAHATESDRFPTRRSAVNLRRNRQYVTAQLEKLCLAPSMRNKRYLEKKIELAICSMSVYFLRMKSPTATKSGLLSDDFTALQADTLLLDGKPWN